MPRLNAQTAIKWVKNSGPEMKMAHIRDAALTLATPGLTQAP